MVQQLLERFAYVAILLLLLVSGLGIPVPEELVQLTAGYLVRRGVLSPIPVLVAAWVGVVTGDYLLFRLGRSKGPRVLESPRLARVLTPRRRALVERHFARHALLTIAAARHASGLRLPVFALAGASGVRSATFLLADGLSALVSVPLVVGLGWYFAGHLEALRKEIHWIELALLLAVAAGVAVRVAVVRKRARRAARPDPGAPPS